MDPAEVSPMSNDSVPLLMPTPAPSPAPGLPPAPAHVLYAALASNSTSYGQLMTDIVRALDEGPMTVAPQLAVALAVATPLALIACCLLLMVCRGVPTVCCGGRCTHWRRMPKEAPKGLEPDQAIGEHQDEHCDVDSVDEESHADVPFDEDDAHDVDNAPHNGNGQRECCSKVAAVLAAGMEEEAQTAAPGCNGMPATALGRSRKANGKSKVVTVVESA